MLQTLTALLHLFRILSASGVDLVSEQAGQLKSQRGKGTQHGRVTHLYFTKAALPMAAIVRGSHNMVAANTTLNAKSPLCGGDSKCIVSPEKSYLFPPAGGPALTAADLGCSI